MKESDITKFLVSVSGQIESASFGGGICDSELYIRYDIVYGPDWQVVSGLTGGVSQLAAPGHDAERVVFNMPVEFVLSSTNVAGWPQLVLSVYGISPSGVEGVRGYGRAHLPSAPGPRRLELPLAAPRPATSLGEWLAWLTGRTPELSDPKMLAHGKDNYLIRTQSYGRAAVAVSMVSKDLHKLGYDNRPASCNQSCKQSCKQSY